MRTDPPVSDPSAPKTIRAATAAPDPLEEPPDTWAVFHGLRQSPKWTLWPVGPPANSERFNHPTDTAPALSNRAIRFEVNSDRKSRRMSEPQDDISPAR